jgi:LCP family protein required for cell wall assembly
MIPESFMPTNGEQQPPGPPDYKVYRSRRSLLSRLRTPDLSGLRERSKRSSKRPDGGERPGRSRGKPLRRWTPRRILKWVALAALGWILISFLAFAVSAQIQSAKLSGEAQSALHGNPFLLPNAQTILVLGTDARPTSSKEPGASGPAAPSQQCFEQQAHGDAPHGSCSQGEFRSDTLMLIRAGGGVFRKLSIPRDSYAEIPGQESQKINAAYAFGGAALTIKTVEKFLGLKIDHLAIVDFTGFEKLINAVGGVEVNVPHKICAEIAGGAGHGQGGISLRLHKGENTLDGQTALAYSRVREPSECPGPGKSAYTLGYNDFNREQAQQAVITGIKERLTDPLRLPYNFIMGPIIGWDAPKAFVSDMGFFTMPQLVLAAAIGGNSTAQVLCAGANSGCGEGPGGSIEVPESVRRKAVKKFLNG